MLAAAQLGGMHRRDRVSHGAPGRAGGRAGRRRAANESKSDRKAKQTRFRGTFATHSFERGFAPVITRLPMAAAAEPAPAPGKLDPADVVGELDEELVCTLCRDVLRQPHSCQAGHSFCKDCIAEWLGRSRTCPIDRAVLGGVETLTRQRPLENMISRLTVRCPHHGREDGRPAKRPRRSQPDDGPSEPQAGDGSDGDGCGWTGKLSERAAHLADECEFARKLCTHQGCGQRVPVAEVAAHAVACEYRPVACEHCGQSRQARALNIHKNVCPRAPVDCPYKGCGCSARVLRGGINQHLTEFAREHAKMTAEKLTLLATKVEHKMTRQWAASRPRRARATRSTPRS